MSGFIASKRRRPRSNCSADGAALGAGAPLPELAGPAADIEELLPDASGPVDASGGASRGFDPEADLLPLRTSPSLVVGTPA